MNLRKLAVASAVVAVAILLGCLTPKQAGDVTAASCSIVSSLVEGVPDSICATAAELGTIGAIVVSARADAGPERKLAPCRMVAGVCATELELDSAISAIRKMRASR